MEHEKRNQEQSFKLADEMSKAIIDLLPGEQNVVIKKITENIIHHREVDIHAKKEDVSILTQLLNDLTCTPQ